MMAETTKEWTLYENGKNYNKKIKPYDYYETVDANLDFYAGNQWRNIDANDAPTPVFNIVKRFVAYFVAALTSNRYKVRYLPLQYSDDDNDPDTEEETMSKMATAEVENLFDKFDMPSRIREALFDAAIMGDGCAHIYFDPDKLPFRGAKDEIEGEICFELVDGTNVFFGNANNPSTDVNIQPYIIIVGRDLVDNLKHEAKSQKKKTLDGNEIVPDTDYNDLAGDMSDVEIESDEYGKALYLIVYKYDRSSKTIKVSKCTKTAYIYKDHDTGLSMYPVAWMNWEKQKNQYHGRAVCTDIIDNQIFINRMFAMVMYNLMITAFPKLIYDADRITGFTAEIGTAIGIHDMQPGDNVANVAKYLEPGNMSAQIAQILDKVIQVTKETIGANDVLLGNIKPEQASGRSIIAVTENAKVPLTNTEGNLTEWIKKIGDIFLDAMGTYYGERPVVKRNEGKQFIELFDFTKLKGKYLTTKAEVGKKSYYSEIAEQETIDTLLQGGLIDLITWLKIQPDGVFSKKDDLMKILELKLQEVEGQPPQVSAEEVAQFIESLPQDVQQELLNMDDQLRYETAVRMMQGI